MLYFITLLHIILPTSNINQWINLQYFTGVKKIEKLLTISQTAEFNSQMIFIIYVWRWKIN